MEDIYKDSDYEETSHVMPNSSISLNDLQGEIIVDNENKRSKEIGSFI